MNEVVSTKTLDDIYAALNDVYLVARDQYTISCELYQAQIFIIFMLGIIAGACIFRHLRK